MTFLLFFIEIKMTPSQSNNVKIQFSTNISSEFNKKDEEIGDLIENQTTSS